MSDGDAGTDHGRARERTALAWTRTGLSFAVAGGLLMRFLGDGGSRVHGLAAALVALGSIAWLWGWRSPVVQPAIDTPLGRAVIRSLALGTAAVAALAIVVQLIA